MSVRVRFAPSPTGHLHVGNVRTALYNWLFARQAKGAFILRLEDTDVERSEKRFERQLINDLRWLALNWDESIDGGPYGPYRQSERRDLHQSHARQLFRQDKAYYCFCPQEELEEERRRQLASGRPPRYSGKCRCVSREEAAGRIEHGEPAVLRLRVREGTAHFEDLVFGPLEVNCEEIGDFVLLRSDGSPTYNFACVVDDALMEISDVIRGEGHISNTYRQLLIYEALGLRVPRFAHLSTILGKDGSKLSKRHGATSIDEFQEQGYLPAALVNYLALLGWAPREESREILTPDELIAEFDLSRVNRSPATFDPEKLNWVNRSHLKKLDKVQLAELAIPYLQQRGWVAPEPAAEVRQWLADLVDAIVNYLDKVKDVASEAAVVFEFDPSRALSNPDVQKIVAADGAREVIREFRDQIQKQEPFGADEYKTAVGEVKKATGRKGKELFHPIRVALTGRISGPELDKLIPLFERGKTLNLPVKIAGIRERIQAVLEQLQ